MGRHSRLCALALATVLCAGLGCDPAFLAEFRNNFRGQLGTAAEGQMCGDRSDVAAIIQDCPMEGVCFTPACQAHDQCYAACAVSRAECDRQFRLAAGDTCVQIFALGDPNFNECLYFAHLYWTLVQLYGEDFYVCDNSPPQGPQGGACCRGSAADASCADVASQAECPFEELFIAGLRCEEVESQLGGCPAPPNDDCGNAVRVCAGQSPGVGLGSCDAETPLSLRGRGRGEGGWAGDRTGAESASDTQAAPRGNTGGSSARASHICSVSSQDCVFGEPCLPHDGDAYRCIVPADNRLSSTDGPNPGEVCGVGDDQAFQADVWYEYVAPCSGSLSIQMCNGTFYDSMIAVYGTGDPAGGCVCPRDSGTLLICDDDGCGGFGNPSAATLPVIAGACYLVRVGGWSGTGEASTAARGVSRLDIGVLCEQAGTSH